MGSVDDVKPCN